MLTGAHKVETSDATIDPIHIVWIGPPKFHDGGHDVIGLESIYENFLAFNQQEKSKALTFWCQKQYEKQYEEYLRKENIIVNIRTIEDYLEQCINHPDNYIKEMAKKINQIYIELTSPSRNEIVDRVVIKNTFSLFLMAATGGYYLDSNVVASKNEMVSFPSYDTFHYPWLWNSDESASQAEIWLFYSPPHNLDRARESLDFYFKFYKEEVADRIKKKEKGYNKSYHRRKAALALRAATLDCTLLFYPNKEGLFVSLTELPYHPTTDGERKTIRADVWEVDMKSQVKYGCFVKELNISKHYYNSHMHLAKGYNSAPGPISHAKYASMEDIRRDIKYGINFSELRCSEHDKYVTRTNETLLHILMRSDSDDRVYLECAALYLEHGVDINAIYDITKNVRKKSFVSKQEAPKKLKSNCLMDVIEERLIQKLDFLLSQKDIRLDIVLNNETPLLKAIHENNDSLTIPTMLLEKNADPNQTWPGQSHTPLYLAVESNNWPLVALLLRYGADPTMDLPNQKFTILTGIVLNGHIQVLLDNVTTLNKEACNNLYEIALGANKLEVIKLLLSKKADVISPVDEESLFGLKIAILISDDNTVRELLLRHPEWQSEMIERLSYRSKQKVITEYTVLNLMLYHSKLNPETFITCFGEKWWEKDISFNINKRFDPYHQIFSHFINILSKVPEPYRLKFSEDSQSKIKFADDLIKVLEYLPAEERFNFASGMKKTLVWTCDIFSQNQLIPVLDVLPVDKRLSFLRVETEFQSIASWHEISMIIDRLPESDRLTFLKEKKDEFCKFSHDNFEDILEKLPVLERFLFAREFLPMIKEMQEHRIEIVLQRLPREYAIALTKELQLSREHKPYDFRRE